MKPYDFEHDNKVTKVRIIDNEFIVEIYENRTITDIYDNYDDILVLLESECFESLDQVNNYTNLDLYLSDFGFNVNVLASDLLNKYSDMDFADYDQEQALDTVCDLIDNYGFAAADHYLSDYVENGSALPVTF